MKKIFYYLVAIFAIFTSFTSCNDDCDHNLSDDKGSTTTLPIYGSWYNEETNEEDRYIESGRFYSRYCNTQRSDENEGRYEYDDKNKRLTWTYKFMGQMQFQDWKVKEINDTKLVLYSSTNGTHEYVRISETLQMRVDETYNLYMSTPHAYSTNPSIVSINSKGEIKSEGRKGYAYIKIPGQNGTICKKVIVGDDCNDLWYDYPSLLNKDYSEVVEVLGKPDINGEDGYSYGYFPLMHDIIHEVDVLLGEKSLKADFIILNFMEGTPASQIKDYLNVHYYACPQFGKNFYTTHSTLEKSQALIEYKEEKDQLVFVNPLMQIDEDLWPDFTGEFGKTIQDIEKKYGPLTNGTPYYLLENDYISSLIFMEHEKTGLIYSYGLVLKDPSKKEEIHSFLSKKYNCFKQEEDGSKYNYRDGDTNQTSKVGVIYDVKEGFIIYVDIVQLNSKKLENVNYKATKVLLKDFKCDIK